MPRFFLLLCCVAFGIAYGQAPLYYSNQNQYFLHGLADAGVGNLEEDWLARTADPTPLFSLLVQASAGFPWVFHLYYLLLQGIYLASLIALFAYLARERDSLTLRLLFIALIISLHSSLARWISHRLFGLDYPWYFQAGVAGQYVLGGMLQPSTFGVLLVLAIALFVWERPFLAVACVCLGATVHSTYLLPAAFLTLGFLFVLWRQDQPGKAVRLGAFAIILVTPVMLFVLLTFQPTSADSFERAQETLVHLRIPHHCLPELWLDPIAGFQIGWMLLGLALCWNTRLFPIMGMALLLGALLTLAQWLTDSDTLALLFPWRVSAVLMSAATAVILTRLILALAPWLDRPLTAWAAAALVMLLAFAGAAILSLRQGYQSNPSEVPLMEFVRENKRPGEVYLLPVRIPNLKGTTRGSLSSDFKPPAAKQTDPRLVPVDLQRFRLHTGAPIYVDFKAIPYHDTDVIEWRRRLERAEWLYVRIQEGNLKAIRPELDAEGITHLVVPGHLDLEGGVELVFDKEGYRVYHLVSMNKGT